MPKIKVKGQMVQAGERPQTNGRTHAHTRMLPNILSPLLHGMCKTNLSVLSMQISGLQHFVAMSIFQVYFPYVMILRGEGKDKQTEYDTQIVEHHRPTSEVDYTKGQILWQQSITARMLLLMKPVH